MTATSGATSVSLSPNTTNAVGGIGQFAIGTFTADSTTQDIVFSTTGNANLQSAFQLRGSPIISGTISYCSNPVPGPVPNVTLTLTGNASGSTLSDGSGNYTLSAPPGGNYTVTPTKAARAPGSASINTSDVIATQRHFLNLGTPLAGCRLTAADVKGDSSVNTSDVIAIQRFFLGLSTGISNTGKYKFTPASRTYTGLVTSQTAQDYDTLVLGDTAASFVELLDSPSQTEADDGTNAGEAPSTVAAVALPEVAVNQSMTNFIARVKSSAIDAKDKLVGFQGDWVSKAAQGTQLIWAPPPNHFMFIDADLNPSEGRR